MYEVLHPEVQQLHQFDWSSGHAKCQEGGLRITSMLVKYGGKGGVHMRDTVMTADCLGTEPAILFSATTRGGAVTWHEQRPQERPRVVIAEHDFRLKPGEVQECSFKSADKKPPPPFYEVGANMEDVHSTDGKGKEIVIEGYAGKVRIM